MYIYFVFGEVLEETEKKKSFIWAYIKIPAKVYDAYSLMLSLL